MVGVIYLWLTECYFYRESNRPSGDRCLVGAPCGISLRRVRNASGLDRREINGKSFNPYIVWVQGVYLWRMVNVESIAIVARCMAARAVAASR